MAHKVGVINGLIYMEKSDGTSGWYREYHIGANQTDPGASGATKTELKATFSWLLNAITEYLYYVVDIHDDWDGASDIEILVHGYLAAGETANDLIRMSILCDYYGEHDNANAPKTQTLTADHDIASDNDQYDHHMISFVLNWDEGGNVLEVGDDLHIRVYLDDVTTAPVVTGFNICHVTIRYRTKYPAIAR